MRKFLKFTETNSWEGETWDVYCLLLDEEQENLAERFVEDWNSKEGPNRSGDYAASIEEMEIEDVDAICANKRVGYYDTPEWFDLPGKAMTTMEQVIDAIENWQEGDGRIDWDDYFYKLAMFY